MAKHIELGKQGEAVAVEYLKKKNYQILEQNWRHSRAEVDIIAKDGDTLVFIEVKTRSSEMWGKPALSVTPKKERLLSDVSSVYMEQIGHTWEIRFDIVAVIILNDNYQEVKHYKDAFFPGLDS